MSPCWKRKVIIFVHNDSHMIGWKVVHVEPEEKFPSRVASKMKARRNGMAKVSSSSSKGAVEHFTAEKLQAQRSSYDGKAFIIMFKIN